MRVYAAVVAHAVEMLGAMIAASAPAGTPAVPEDVKEVAGVGYNIEAVAVVGRGEVLLACLGQLDSYSLEACIVVQFPSVASVKDYQYCSVCYSSTCQ